MDRFARDGIWKVWKHARSPVLPLPYVVVVSASGRYRPGAEPGRFAPGLRHFRTELDGRGGEIRTHDLLYPKQTRYQAALRPDGAFNSDTRGR